MTESQHFVLTRHGMNYGFGPPSMEWLQQRRKWLLHITAESLRRQTFSSFSWLIFVDGHWADFESAALSESLPCSLSWEVIATRSTEDLELRAQVKNAVEARRESHKSLVTTRLDSDDGIACDFMETLESLANSTTSQPLIIDFPRGLVLDYRRRVSLRRNYFYSPFQSLVQPSGSEEIQTVFDSGHLNLSDLYLYHPVLTESPMWYMSIHSGNVGNRAFGLVQRHTPVPSAIADFLNLTSISFRRQIWIQAEVVWSYLLFFLRSTGKLERLKTLRKKLRT